MLILKNRPNGEEPKELVIAEVSGPRVPVKGETISSGCMTKYIQNIAVEKKNMGYINNFALSRFIVDEVEHAPEENKGKLEALAVVTALKI